MIDNKNILTVADLTRRIKSLIEDGIPFVWVEGEISNLKNHSSGHRYFTLKDAGAQISCVMWRTRRKPSFELKDGTSIRAWGKATVWEKGGRYQFDVQEVLPVGLGDLQAAFEELKRKLTEEGLFDAGRKKPLPKFPRAIGIATSKTGAAIKDIVWGFANRFPAAELFFIPVAVQGEGSAEQIAAAIELFNRHNLVDTIVIGRGGGSLEDLWAFNEEIVVRAVAGSKIPIVSAVGHEVDVSLSDFAADVRAPTPTAVASLVVPDKQEVKKSLLETSTRHDQALKNKFTLWRERLKSLENSYGFKRVLTVVNERRMIVDETAEMLLKTLKQKIEYHRELLRHKEAQLKALSPVKVLQRGYSIAKRKDGVIVKDYRQVKPGEELAVTFADGGSDVYVLEVWSDDRRK